MGAGVMPMDKRARGRPRKHGVKSPWVLGRALKVIYAYNEARKHGQKHSVAVREAVAFVKRLRPAMPVSETEVRRILAEFRPRHGRVALQSNYRIVEEDEAARLRWRIEQLRQSLGIKNPSGSSNLDPRRPLKGFLIGYVERPIYPRHNAKTPTS
jgi:hypothetical protein